MGLYFAPAQFKDLCAASGSEEKPQVGELVVMKATGAVLRIVASRPSYLVVNARGDWALHPGDEQHRPATPEMKRFQDAPIILDSDLAHASVRDVEAFCAAAAIPKPGRWQEILGLLCFLVGFFMTYLGMYECWPVLKVTHTTFEVPSNLPVPNYLEECGCVVLLGMETLQPIAMNVLAVTVIFGGNFVLPFVRHVSLRPDAGIATQLYFAAKRPWMPLLLTTSITSVASFAVLLFNALFATGISLWTRYQAMYTGFVNSGAQTLMVTGVYGAFLTNVLHDSIEAIRTQDFFDPLAFRFLGALVVFLVELPPLFTHIIPGALLWAWAVLPGETLICLLVVVFFPSRGAQVDSFIRGIWLGNCATKRILGLFFLYFFPLLLPVRAICQRLGVGIGRRSPVGYLARTFLISMFTLGKVLMQQAMFNASTLFYNGVGYTEVVPVMFLARHWTCTLCLMSHRVAMLGEAWRVTTFVL